MCQKVWPKHACVRNSIGHEEHFDLALENQHGDAITLDKADQEALVTGLSLHDKGKVLMDQVLHLFPSCGVS